MAELLVRAKGHYLDDLKQEEIDKMTKEQRQSWEARSQKGDIIVIRPDGWAWGREECPPNFVVVKLPNVNVADVKHYEQSLMDTTIPEKPVILRHRKYAIDTLTVDDCAKDVGGKKEISQATLATKLITKTSEAVK